MAVRELEGRIESMELELQKLSKRVSEIVELLSVLEQAEFHPLPSQRNQMQQRIQRLKQR